MEVVTLHGSFIHITILIILGPLTTGTPLDQVVCWHLHPGPLLLLLQPPERQAPVPRPHSAEEELLVGEDPVLARRGHPAGVVLPPQLLQLHPGIIRHPQFNMVAMAMMNKQQRCLPPPSSIHLICWSSPPASSRAASAQMMARANSRLMWGLMGDTPLPRLRDTSSTWGQQMEELPDGSRWKSYQMAANCYLF